MTTLYRLALRVLLPGVYAHHRAETVETAARLAAEARQAGVTAWTRYWLTEFTSLARTAWHERPARKAPMAASTIFSLLRDVRYSVRLLWRTPGVTAIALLTLALGIGANTAIFSIVNGVLLRPLPYPEPERLFLIRHALISNPDSQVTVTPGNYYDIQRAVQSLEVAAFSSSTATLTGRGEPERLLGVGSPGGALLKVLGVSPQLGRVFNEADDQPGAPATVVISDRLWRRLFEARADALGQTLMLGGVPMTVIGVMPAGFTFPDSDTDVWSPARQSAQARASRTEYYLTLVGRLQPGAAAAAARGELDAVMARLRTEYADANGTMSLVARPLADALVANVSQLLWFLMGSVGCVLLIACANLANLLLSKATGRGREIAIRQAIGANRASLVRQLLVESVVLALMGGVAGVLVGVAFLRALVAWLPAGIPRIAEATVDMRVLAATFAAAAVTGLFFGLAPALQLARLSPSSVLRDDARTSTSRSPLRAMLVIGELAIALVLLAGAGLLIRSFVLLQRVDPGFATDRMLTFQVRMEGPAYADAKRRIAFVNGVVERLRSMPGVTDAAAGSGVPVVARGTGAWFNLLSRPWPPGTTPPAVPYRVITQGYFKAMKIPLLRGRFLEERDGLDGTPSVVISESVARRFWPAGDAIGSEIYMGAPSNKLFERATVVGIVKDVQLSGLDGSVVEAVYGLNTLMPFWRAFTFAVRTSGDPLSVAGEARAIVRQADPALAVTSLQAMTDILRTSVAPTRASMMLLVLFAAVALCMAAVGVFGVMSYAVTLRAREMGIRLALGASPREVRGMIIRDGLKQALAGITIGIAGALWLTRLMDSMLFGVTAGDPLTLVAVAGILLTIALAACYLPARRATRVDPLVVLRAP